MAAPSCTPLDQQGSPEEEIATIQREIDAKLVEVEELRRKIRRLTSVRVSDRPIVTLRNDQIERYSRHLVLPEFGVPGQLRLVQGSVLLVGCGGLGCPAALYLAAAGVGRLGLVDHDTVELSNLHRQVGHDEQHVGVSKVSSLSDACRRINSSVVIEGHETPFNRENALSLVSQYDLVLDCTDNVPTRYLLNDSCVLLRKALVSGGALRLEGQLTVYNWRSGPCLRCVFPEPPPAAAVTRCSDGGVLGPVPGIIGILQAFQAIRVLQDDGGLLNGRLLLFDGADFSFRTVRLRTRRPECVVCGLGQELPGVYDMCDGPIHLLDEHERVSVSELAALRAQRCSHTLVDVRPPHELLICQLEDTLNIPMDKFYSGLAADDLSNVAEPVLLLCRRGNDSQLAVRLLQKLLPGKTIQDVRGGLHAWQKHVDSQFPVY